MNHERLWTLGKKLRASEVKKRLVGLTNRNHVVRECRFKNANGIDR